VTPDALAALHRAAFTSERPWSAEEFEELLKSKFIRLHPHPHGFALSRTIAGESELLTLAVDPTQQGKGIGRTLTQVFLADVAQRAETAFLEVAADNAKAIHLYTTEGFAEIARRQRYYARKNAPAADAIIMRQGLTFGQRHDSSASFPESG